MIGVEIRLNFVKYNMCLEGVSERMILEYMEAVIREK